METQMMTPIRQAIIYAALIGAVFFAYPGKCTCGTDEMLEALG